MSGFSKSQSRRSAMRIPETCERCNGPAIVYATVQGSQFTTRYRRCRICGATSKTVSVNRVLFSNDIDRNEAMAAILQVSTDSQLLGNLK
jgi:transcription elongation factor Elf1